MAKELTWFKFNISAWMMGRIQREHNDTIVSYLRICCQYWKKGCLMNVEDAKLECEEKEFNSLILKKIIKIESENIIIDFLDEQFIEITGQKKQASEAGKRSAELRRLLNANATTVERPLNDRATDKIRIDKIRIEKDIKDRKLKFSESLKPFLEVYGKEMLNDFYKYWTEPNKSKTKFRMESQKFWDLKKRLSTWDKNNFDKKLISKEATPSPFVPK